MSSRQRSIRILLVCFALFSTAVTFGNIFINIYIWKEGQDLTDVALYNLSFYGMSLVSTLAGNYLIRIMHSRMVFIAASTLVMFTFIFLPLVTADWGSSVIVGGIFGMAVGLFYIGFNLYTLVLTNETTRTYILSMEEVLGRLTGLLVPVLSSMLLEYIGYFSTFSLLTLIMFLFVLASFLTPKYKSAFSLHSIEANLWRKYQPILVSLVAFGFMNGVMVVASSVLVFSRISSEMFIGLLNTLLAFLGIVSAYYLGQKLPRKGPKRFVQIGTFLCVLASVFLFFDQLIFLLIFNVLIVIGLPLLWIPVNVTHFQKMKELACPTKQQCDLSKLMAYLFIRELFLTIGRVIFFCLLVFTPLFQETDSSQYFLLIVILLLPILILKGNLVLIKNQKSTP